jgi:hypothetical protein
MKLNLSYKRRITAYEGKQRQSDADLSANTRPDLGTHAHKPHIIGVWCSCQEFAGRIPL